MKPIHLPSSQHHGFPTKTWRGRSRAGPTCPALRGSQPGSRMPATCSSKERGQGFQFTSHLIQTTAHRKPTGPRSIALPPLKDPPAMAVSSCRESRTLSPGVTYV